MRNRTKGELPVEDSPPGSLLSEGLSCSVHVAAGLLRCSKTQRAHRPKEWVEAEQAKVGG